MNKSILAISALFIGSALQAMGGPQSLFRMNSPLSTVLPGHTFELYVAPGEEPIVCKILADTTHIQSEKSFGPLGSRTAGASLSIPFRYMLAIAVTQERTLKEHVGPISGAYVNTYVFTPSPMTPPGQTYYLKATSTGEYNAVLQPVTTADIASNKKIASFKTEKAARNTVIRIEEAQALAGRLRGSLNFNGHKNPALQQTEAHKEEIWTPSEQPSPAPQRVSPISKAIQTKYAEQPKAIGAPSAPDKPKQTSLAPAPAQPAPVLKQASRPDPMIEIEKGIDTTEKPFVIKRLSCQYKKVPVDQIAPSAPAPAESATQAPAPQETDMPQQQDIFRMNPEEQKAYFEQKEAEYKRHRKEIRRMPHSVSNAIHRTPPELVDSLTTRLHASQWWSFWSFGFSYNANRIARNWKDINRIVESLARDEEIDIASIRESQLLIYKTIFALDTLLTDYPGKDGNAQQECWQAIRALTWCFDRLEENAQTYLKNLPPMPPVYRIDKPSDATHHYFNYKQPELPISANLISIDAYIKSDIKKCQEAEKAYDRSVEAQVYRALVNWAISQLLPLELLFSWDNDSSSTTFKAGKHEIATWDSHKEDLAEALPKTEQVIHLVASKMTVKLEPQKITPDASLLPTSLEITPESIRRDITILHETKNAPHLQLIADTANILITLGEKMHAQGSADQAQALCRNAAIFIEQSNQAIKNQQVDCLPAVLCCRLQPFIREAIATQNQINQEFLIDLIDTTTYGSTVVHRLKSAGEKGKAKLLNRIIQAKLEKIHQKAEAQSASDHARAPRISAWRDGFEFCDDPMSLQELKENWEAIGLGVKDTSAAALDPMTYVHTATSLIRAADFVLMQISRLEAAQDAIIRGDRQQAEYFMTEFHENNTQVKTAATEWIENFNHLPQKEKIRFISGMVTSFVIAKPVAEIHMWALNAGLRSAVMLGGEAADIVWARIGQISDMAKIFKCAPEPESVLSRLKGYLEKGVREENRIEYMLDADTKIMFRKDFGEYAHCLEDFGYPEGIDIDHYNIEIQTRNLPGSTINRWNKEGVWHIVIGSNGKINFF